MHKGVELAQDTLFSIKLCLAWDNTSPIHQRINTSTRAPNIFYLEFHRDLSLVLFFLAYSLHHLVESLLTIT